MKVSTIMCTIVSFLEGIITIQSRIMLAGAYIAGNNYNDLHIWFTQTAVVILYHLRSLCLFRNPLPIMVNITLTIVED